jgi:hypothetical protein
MSLFKNQSENQTTSRSSVPPAQSELEITISEIEHGIRQKNVLLNSKNAEYTTLVEDRCRKKRDWKMACSKKILELSDDPVTIRKELVAGDREVSKLEMKFEISFGIERACLESMKDLRSQIDIYRSFLSYHKSERFMTTI